MGFSRMKNQMVLLAVLVGNASAMNILFEGMCYLLGAEDPAAKWRRAEEGTFRICYSERRRKLNAIWQGPPYKVEQSNPKCINSD